MNTENHDICILYGSQTGTAKFVAEDIQRELWKYNYKTLLSSLDSYNIINLPEEQFIIFIVSTTGKFIILKTGYGETPKNMKQFWTFLLRKDLPSNSLTNLNYTIFGLGDSSYEKFNTTAKLLNTRLRQLSAKLFHPVGLGDDQHDFGYEGELDPWSENLFNELKNYFPNKSPINEEMPIIPKYITTLYKNNEAYEHSIHKNNQLSNKQSILDIDNVTDDKINRCRPFVGHINNYKYLSTDDCEKIVVHLELDIIPFDGEALRRPYYRIGDVALIYPKNDKKFIETLMSLTKLHSDNIIVIEKNPQYKTEFHQDFPNIISARQLFEEWLDINGVPNRYFCKIASQYALEELHKEKLQIFASKTSVLILLIL